MDFDKDIKRFFISLFVLLNIFTVLYVNRPLPVKDIQGSKLKGVLHSFPSENSDGVFDLLFTGYGNLFGLGTRWLMFILQDKYNWKYLIKARYEDSSEVVLPIPRQGNRNFLKRNLFDFKDAKFQYNFNYRSYAKEHYASYLCRKYSKNNESKIKSVVFELYTQNILEPNEATRRNAYLEPIIRKETVGIYKCNVEGGILSELSKFTSVGLPEDSKPKCQRRLADK